MTRFAPARAHYRRSRATRPRATSALLQSSACSYHTQHTPPPVHPHPPWAPGLKQYAPRELVRALGTWGPLRGGLPKTGRRSPALDAYETVVYSLYCVAERPATSSYKLHAYHRCDIPPLRTRGISMLCLGGHFERLVALKESNAGTASSTAILPVRSARATRFGNVAIMQRLWHCAHLRPNRPNRRLSGWYDVAIWSACCREAPCVYHTAWSA